MSLESRFERLAAELQAMRALCRDSRIVTFECAGRPPDRYTLSFRGRGLRRRSSAAIVLDFIDHHDVEIQMPRSYPSRPPDIRWMTPLFHPNVSFSGLLTLPDIGLSWNEDLGLDVICERLWDVARFRFVDLTRATNRAAQSFFERNPRLRLPTDARPLRGCFPQDDITYLGDCARRPVATHEQSGEGDDSIRYVSPVRELPPRRPLFHIG